ncbi:MAG: patatin-like protein [Burkholderiaceae bacterium]
MNEDSAGFGQWSDPITHYSADIRFGVVMYGGVSLAVYINGVMQEMFNLVCATPAEGVRLAKAGAPATREVYRILAWLAESPLLRRRFVEFLERNPDADGRDTDPMQTLVGHWQRFAAHGDDLSAAPGDASASAGEPTQGPRSIAGLMAARPPVRFLIDVISGTSAGGLNGLCLAKAIANGEDCRGMQSLWLEQADLSLLLNDRKGRRGLRSPPRSDGEPSSLLNGDRLYEKLADMLQAMPALSTRGMPAGLRSPISEGIDLSVTATDIRGVPVPLRLLDKVVYEKRHRLRFRFRSRDGIDQSGNDFEAANVPFLAFAGRASSSFPFAFEPVQLHDLQRLSPQADPGRWRAHFADMSEAVVQTGQHAFRSLGDGGYLDNKPFSYAVEALSDIEPLRPVRRQLVYVEPSPRALAPAVSRAARAEDADERPDALENTIAALLRVPRYETIREDLNTIVERNRMITRIEHIIRQGERDLDERKSMFDDIKRIEGDIPDWRELPLSRLLDYYGLSFLPYRRLRVYSVTDMLAGRLVRRLGMDERSDMLRAIRALVQAWRERRYSEDGGNGKAPVNTFLSDYDIDYRQRRLAFMARRSAEMIAILQRLHETLLERSDSRGQQGSSAHQGRAGEAAFALTDDDIEALERVGDHFGIQLYPDADEQMIIESVRILSTIRRELVWARRTLLEHWQRPIGPAGLGAETSSDDAHAKTGGDVASGDVSRPAIPEPVLGRAREVGAMLLADPAGLAATDPSAVGSDYRRMAVRAARWYEADVHAQESADADFRALVDAEIARHDYQSIVPEDARRHAYRILGNPRLTPVEGDRVEIAIDELVDTGIGRMSADGGGDAPPSMLSLNSGLGRRWRMYMANYLIQFDSYDQMSYPLAYGAIQGEPASVDLVRISPLDATSLIDESRDPRARTKLNGTALGHFGAFLDRRWRQNDLMWGRLDGAERLIHSILRGPDPASRALREKLVEAAHSAILDECLVADGRQELATLLTDALREAQSGGGEQLGTITPAIERLLDRLKIDTLPARERLTRLLTSLIEPGALTGFVRSDYDKPGEPDRETTFSNLSRGVAITGDILKGISNRHDKVPGLGMASRWLARLGLVLQGFVAVSLPGSLGQL